MRRNQALASDSARAVELQGVSWPSMALDCDGTFDTVCYARLAFGYQGLRHETSSSGDRRETSLKEEKDGRVDREDFEIGRARWRGRTGSFTDRGLFFGARSGRTGDQRRESG